MPQLSLSDDLLYHLTRIKMPREFPKAIPEDIPTVAGLSLPVYRSQVLVVGSGAAGLRAAVELKRRGQNVILATSGVGMGTSACSGSDKQTLHTASTRGHGDDYLNMATAIAAGGAMDHDVAYVESVGSNQALAGLQFMGLPIPQDRYGAALRYQTDHDEYGRATSCGPRTSRLMVKVLAEECKRLSIPVLSRASAVKLQTQRLDDQEKAVGLFLATNDQSHNDYGLSYVEFDAIVLATGGPGELYRDSVYPGKCHGSLGLALETGLTLSNLTESQFGIGTSRDNFPWNLSGSYVQVVPHIYSVDNQGKEHHFLANYFADMDMLCDAVFKKGYQWPFHAERTLHHQSSLVDLAIYEQQQLGRSVYMDFQRNPEPFKGRVFDINRLSGDAKDYLDNNQALGDLPIHRLEKLNPLAIELYRQNGTDLRQEPLRFAMNNQHMNGGVEVDLWGQTSLKACYAIGELASTHGVTRPGGAALNAGQVFAVRVADHISHTSQSKQVPLGASLDETLTEIVSELTQALTHSLHKQTLTDRRMQVQGLMSDHIGFICHYQATLDAQSTLHRLSQQPMYIDNPAQIPAYFHWKQNTLAAAAIATALADYMKKGGISRGARLICDKSGQQVPMAANQPLEQFRHQGGHDPLGKYKQLIQYTDENFTVRWRSVSALEDVSNIYFEKNWPDFLNSTIYKAE
ncbi:FAD-dependent oxidoreductase [Marinomonas communis]|uniref:Succinate dehydrogenase/fumarate reductase flavoprotein subunit n=1 Tax=Marinomonas communis TaxID=28254 RepID=A0A4R6X223_9GAMM|nr:FAD-binding protein [Marinomonas communis]TDR05893.1 succinate dehydrogenase/fumarate reductase flavoprotein subunit [Marinomonas communis]